MPLDLDDLLRLQQIVIGDDRFVQLGLHAEGGFGGTTANAHRRSSGHVWVVVAATLDGWRHGAHNLNRNGVRLQARRGGLRSRTVPLRFSDAK